MKKEKEAREAYLRSNPDRTVRVITYKHNKKKNTDREEKTKKERERREQNESKNYNAIN